VVGPDVSYSVPEKPRTTELKILKIPAVNYTNHISKQNKNVLPCVSRIVAFIAIKIDAIFFLHVS